MTASPVRPAATATSSTAPTGSIASGGRRVGSTAPVCLRRRRRCRESTAGQMRKRRQRDHPQMAVQGRRYPGDVDQGSRRDGDVPTVRRADVAGRSGSARAGAAERRGKTATVGEQAAVSDSKGRQTASDIADEQILPIVTQVMRPIGASRWDIAARLPEFPEKVVLAKLGGLVRRGVLSGCACGCRGDFEIRERFRS